MPPSSGPSRLGSIALALATLVVFAGVCGTSALAQTILNDVDLAGVSIDLADSKATGRLERAESAYNAGQYEDAVEQLAALLETDRDALVAVAEGSFVERQMIRWIPLQEFVHLKLRSWAGETPDILVAWRKRFDPSARERFSGIEDSNGLYAAAEEDLAATGVSQLLFRASELAQRHGDLLTARRALARIIKHDLRSSVPDATATELAEAHGRIALFAASQGDKATAEREAALAQKLAPAGKASLSGKSLSWLEAVDEIAGTLSSDTRRDAPDLDLPGKPLWSIPIKLPRDENDMLVREGERNGKPPRSFPVCADGMAVIVDETRVRGIELATGRERWSRPIGIETRGATSRTVGTPLFVASIVGDLVVVRGEMGPTSSRRFSDPLRRPKSRLLAIELASGRLVQEWSIDDAGWAFDGAAVGEGDSIFIPMRYRLEGRPQLYLACFDVVTGTMRWRKRLASADVAGHGEFDEYTHTIPVLRDGTLFVSTHLGAVLALDPASGRTRWAATYERVVEVDPRSREAGPWRQRSLSPCVVDGGLLFCAPHDARTIFALDSETGAARWFSDGPAARESTHLLGATENALVASGRAVQFIDKLTGRTLGRFPPGAIDSERDPAFRVANGSQGLGRGLVLGSHAICPQPDRLVTFQSVSQTADGPGGIAPIRETLLIPRLAQGGNLAWSDGYLVIAGATAVWCFDCRRAE